MQQINGVQKYSVWSALSQASFFPADLYRDIARNWRGIGLRLLVLVLAITWLATAVKLHHGINRFAMDDFPGMVQEFPPITIQDGVVSSPVEQPYTIKDRQSDKAFAIIDTTGAITSLDQTDAIILLTANKVHYRDTNTGQTRIQDLSQVKSFYIDRAKVTNWVNSGAKWFAWIVIPVLFVGSLIYRLVQGLIYAAIGLIWNSAFNARLSYPALMRLSFVAVTPVIFLSTVLFLANINVPFWSLLCLIITMVYLAVSIRANAQPATPAFAYNGPPLPSSQQYGYPTSNPTDPTQAP